MKYDTLKALVNAKVYENTEQRITGGDMNNVLQSAIASLGAHYQMGGLVSPSDQITVVDEPVVFLATTPGTYTYFGNLVVADGEVALLVWSGTAWSKQTPDIATKTEVSQLGQQVSNSVKQDGGFETKSDFSIVDEDNNCIVQFKGGHIKTKDFDSRNSATKASVAEVDNAEDDDESISFVDENANCIAQFKGGNIKLKKFDSASLRKNGTKIRDFRGFSGTNWSISQDNKSASCSTANKRLMYQYPSFEDSFNLSASIIPNGSTFEIAMGKYATLAGTFFTLYYDGIDSKVRVYHITSGGEYQLININFTCQNVRFESGKKIFIEITKFVTNDDNFKIVVCDEFGAKDVFTVQRCVYIGIGSGWGKVFFELLSGDSVTIGDISFGYSVRNELDLIIIGHSYVEGNNLVQAESQDKDKKFSKLITNDIGEGHCITLGQGGERVEYLLDYIDSYCEWFATAKYALMYIGGNDVATAVGTASWGSAVSHLKENMTIVNNKLLAVGIIPVWCTINWWYDYGKPENDTINLWILSTFPNVVDVRKIFEDENGNLDPSKFATDGVHPTIESHTAIYNVIKAQANYMFNI